MDSISEELDRALTKLAKQPESVSHKLKHYIEHLLQLLQRQDEQMLKAYYGIGKTSVQSIESLATQRGESPETVQKTIEQCLRKIAITPEWQMIKQFFNT